MISHNITSGVIQYNANIDKIVVDDMKLYDMLLLVRSKLQDRGADTTRFGLPRWLAYPSEDQFHKFRLAVSKIIDNPKLSKNVLNFISWSRPSPVSTQAEAIKYVSRITKVDSPVIAEIIDACKACNGSNILLAFSTPEKLVRSAQKMLDGCERSVRDRWTIEEVFQAKWKAKQVTLLKCIKYLCYLGLCSTIGTIHNESVGMCAKTEKAYFRDCYSLFRKVCQALGWLVCIDPTFCPGVRVRTWHPRVLSDKSRLIDDAKTLTPKEDHFANLKTEEERIAYANSIHPLAYSYMTDRVRMIKNHRANKEHTKSVVKNALKAKRLKEMDAPKSQVKKAWKAVDEAKKQKRIIVSKDSLYYNKYRDPGYVDWATESYKETEIEAYLRDPNKIKNS